MIVRLSNNYLVALKRRMSEGLSFGDAHTVVKDSSSYSILSCENGYSAMLDAINPDTKSVSEVDHWVAIHSHDEIMKMIERALWIHAWRYTRLLECKRWSDVEAGYAT